MACVSTLKGHMNASAQLQATSWDKIKCLVLVRDLNTSGSRKKCEQPTAGHFYDDYNYTVEPLYNGHHWGTT